MKIIIFSMFIMHVFSQCNLNAQAAIPNSVLACGASEMSSANFKLVGTIGQPIIGLINSSSIFNSQGFWQSYRNHLAKSSDYKSTSYLEVTLTPNPIFSNGTLWFDLDVAQEFTIRIVNVIGMEVRNLGQRYLVNGVHSLPLDLSELNSGIHYIILNNQNYDIKIPFIKI